jgi:hypothetical protein
MWHRLFESTARYRVATDSRSVVGEIDVTVFRDACR